MKKLFRKIPLWVLLFLLISASFTLRKPLFSVSSYAPDPDWTGVLRIWVCASSPFGTGSGLSWLNSRAAAYERSHPGVRIQFTDVPAETASSFENCEHPPDGLIFTPGTLASADHLLSLPIPPEIADVFIACGTSDGEFKAVPVAAGAYFWICADSTLSCAPGSADCPPEYSFYAPTDTPAASYSAALLACFTGNSLSGRPSQYSGADLGLPQAAATEPPVSQSIPLRKPLLFAGDARSHSSVYSLFASGQADAIIATVQDLSRIRLLAGEGRAPEYTVFPGGTAFTDLIALAAVVDDPSPGSDDRERICADFFSHLLTEESQQALANVLAFRTTNGDPLYSTSRDGMAAVEASLHSGIIVPNAFDPTWRERAAQSAQLFIETNSSAADLFYNIFS